jgi:predicted Zn-dependent protease
MKIRTLAGVLLTLVAIVLVSFLVRENQDLLSHRLTLGESASISLAAALIGVFLLGLLPPVTVLVVQLLQRELDARRDRRLSREAESRQGSFRRALDYKADGQWGKAASELQSVLADKPEDFAALLHYGEVLRRQGQTAEALDVHRKASVLYPQSVALLYELAEDYTAMGDDEVGREIRNRILRDFAGVGLGVQRRRRDQAIAERDWLEAGRLQEAIDATLRENADEEELARERRVRMGLAYQRGVHLVDEERFEEAKQIFRGLLTEEPLFIPASIMLGETALLQGSAEAALAEWRRGYAATGSPVFLQRIEDHFIERARPVEAIQTLHELIATADNDLLPRFYLGRLYYRLEMLDEALRQLSSIAERVAVSPTFHKLLARIHERRGNLQRAAQSYMAALEQAGLASTEYACTACGEGHAAWSDRCEQCGAWSSLELAFEEERLTAAELGVRERPVWTVVEDGDDEPFSA